LVFVLGIIAASPSLHQLFHDGGIGNGVDHQCAITVFANGISVLPDLPAVVPPVQSVCERPAPPLAEIRLLAPRFLLRPERGPPRPEPLACRRPALRA
jgi:hypothetical protein